MTCETLSPHTCAGMAVALGEPDLPVVYVAKFREYGILVGHGPTYQVIEHCPWCGQQLPSSLRDEFFDRVERMSLEPESSDLPLDFRSDAWWRIRSRE